MTRKVIVEKADKPIAINTIVKLLAEEFVNKKKPLAETSDK